MNITTTLLTFRVDVSWPDCDVDVVYDEARSAGYSGAVPTYLVGAHKIAPTKRTPSSDSIEYALHLLLMANRNGWNKIPELADLGVSVEKTHGMMMGGCFMECEIDADKYSPELVTRVHEIVNSVFNEHVRYYEV